MDVEVRGGSCHGSEEMGCGCSGGIPSDTYRSWEAVCRIALTVFSGVIAPQVMLFALGVGAGISIADGLYKALSGEPTRLLGFSKPVCAQGYAEMLSGRKFPDLHNLLVTTAFIAAHTMHMPTFFVPFTGVYLGMGYGSLLFEYGRRAWQEHDTPALTPPANGLSHPVEEYGCYGC